MRQVNESNTRHFQKMGSNNIYQFVLQRIHVPHTIVLDKPEHTYTCGRAKNNDIVCLSLTVSRRHCILFHSKNELYVTDLKSSNGLFINGLKQDSYKTIKLHENDVIGIGCPDINVTDHTAFAYKLHVLTSKPQEGRHNTSAFSETTTNFANATPNISPNNKSDVIVKRKREQSIKDTKIIPNKIRKLEDEECQLIGKPVEAKYELIDENDIEIVHILLNNSTMESSNNNCDDIAKSTETNNKLNTSKHTDSNRVEISHGDSSAKQLESSVNCMTRSDQFLNSESVQSFVSSNINNIVKDKENYILPTRNSMESSNYNKFYDEQKQTEKNMLYDKDTRNQGNSTVKVTTAEHINSSPKQNVKYSSKQQTTLNKVETSNKSYNINQLISETNTVENSLPLPPNFVQGEDTLIKLEDELQITDTDDDAIANSGNKNTVPLISPIKLKQIQQEPKTKFSEDNVVNLSDSEDDIFPCSQLFDIGFGMNASLKQEVKEEPAEGDNNRFSRLDDEDLVISLTDSEDEDNNWLHRLSRSQMLNDNDEMNCKNVVDNIKEEDMEVEIIGVDNELCSFKRVIEKLQSGVSARNETLELQLSQYINEKEEPSLSIARTVNELDSSNSCTIERMANDSEDQATKLTECSSDITICNTNISEFPLHESLSPKQNESEITADTSINSIVSIGTDTGKPIVSVNKRKSIERKVPQIEPLHLPTRRRSGGSSKVQEVSEKSTKQKLTTKEKKELQEKMKIEQYLHAKEQKNRKVLHKWADCLPPSKKKISTLTKEEKKALADTRKLKLQEIAMKEKVQSSENNKGKKRVCTKPKAKVSVKTRGDFLVNEQPSSASKSDGVPEKPTTSSTRSAMANEASSTKANEYAKNKDVYKELTANLQNSLMRIDISTVGKIPKKSNNRNKPKTNNTPLENLTLDKRTMKVTDTVVRENHSNDKFKVKPSVSNKEESVLCSESLNKSSNQKQKKRVSFSTVIKTVREYEIEDSNVLKKLTGKDAPMPVEKRPSVKSSKHATESNAKLYEFLLRIFTWNPVWLEEQQHLKIIAPVVRDDELNVMLTHYKSYDEYYNVISPLLLLETWYGITKEFQVIDKDSKRPTLMCSIVENSIQTTMFSTNVFLSTLMLEVLVTKEDLHKRAHPTYGDLVFFEYVKNHEKGQTFHKVFAYVTNVHQTVLTPLTHYNKDLKHYIKYPYALLTYTMYTKPLERNIPVNRVQRLRTVTYLRPNLRLVQALQYLPKSPLMNLILNPKIDMYHLPTVSALDTTISKDKLNEKQLEAVHRVTKAAVQKTAKVCFIQGPPGTGKSKVIVNIVTQILYGDNRYKSTGGPLRMLVCAPSNAAIDEIVLRLLHIRSTIKENRFRMVRIGRSEMMHATVKEISVTELAKRNIKTSTLKTKNIPSDSVEEEKVFLESKMNALRCEIANSHNMDEAYKRHIKMKLSDMTAKYELLKNRRPLNEINPREFAKLQRAAENRILARADIITCTLSSCFTSQMESIFGSNRDRISLCIVDEATQSCEAETLIPLMLGVNILVLVGDPNQLPATVLSPQAKQLGFDQSIFVRVQNAFESLPNNPIIMLDTQYRMQKDISHWPNKFFYGGSLKNATDSSAKFPFHSYRILNLNTNQNVDNFSNTDEAEFVANLIFSMLTSSNLNNWESCIKVGVLTPYTSQKHIMSTKINEKISSVPANLKKKMNIEVNTVDGFQGQERDVIIMSCVRSQKIGFLSDRQRLCVALTRAKRSLILCGNFSIFMRDPMWNSLLTDARSRRVYYNVNATAQPQEIKVHIIKRITTK